MVIHLTKFNPKGKKLICMNEEKTVTGVKNINHDPEKFWLPSTTNIKLIRYGDIVIRF